MLRVSPLNLHTALSSTRVAVPARAVLLKFSLLRPLSPFPLLLLPHLARARPLALPLSLPRPAAAPVAPSRSPSPRRAFPSRDLRLVSFFFVSDLFVTRCACVIRHCDTCWPFRLQSSSCLAVASPA